MEGKKLQKTNRFELHSFTDTGEEVTAGVGGWRGRGSSARMTSRRGWWGSPPASITANWRGRGRGGASNWGRWRGRGNVPAGGWRSRSVTCGWRRSRSRDVPRRRRGWGTTTTSPTTPLSPVGRAWRGLTRILSLKLLICLLNSPVFLDKIVDELSCLFVLQLIIGHSNCVQQFSPLGSDIVAL